MWNYLDAINEGDGDAERYRQFCVGRARGLGRPNGKRLPAATAIGRQQPTHQLQVFWVAARVGGTPIENPRQVSAYHYPRAHGPVSPSFSRAMVAPDDTVLVSGTASIVGHVSQHHGDAQAQLAETLRNLAAVTSHAGVRRDAVQPPGSAQGLRARPDARTDDRRAAAGSVSGRECRSSWRATSAAASCSWRSSA